MKVHKVVSLLVLAVMLALLLSACGTEPVTMSEIPIYPGAELLARGEDELADEMADAIVETLTDEDIATEVNLYALPADTDWDDVKGFYEDELADTDWELEADLSEETEYFSSLGWGRGGGASEQALIVGYVPGIFGSTNILLVGLLSE